MYLCCWPGEITSKLFPSIRYIISDNLLSEYKTETDADGASLKKAKVLGSEMLREGSYNDGTVDNFYR